MRQISAKYRYGAAKAPVDVARQGKALQEAMALAREIGSGWEQMWGEMAMGEVCLAERDAGQAEAHYRVATRLPIMTVRCAPTTGLPGRASRVRGQYRSICVQRKSAIARSDAGSLTCASQTWVVRPP